MTIKPLTWKLIVDEMTFALWTCKKGWSTLPLFEITRYSGDTRYHLSKCWVGAPSSSSHPTLAAAQAAAQGEWNDFINDSIELP